MAEMTGNATIDGALLLDEVEGAGTAEAWLNLCISQGGVVLATPWVFFLAYPQPDAERELYVAYAYGDLRSVGAAGRMCLESGRFDKMSFRRGFGSGRDEEERRVYNLAELVERTERLAQRVSRWK